MYQRELPSWLSTFTKSRLGRSEVAYSYLEASCEMPRTTEKATHLKFQKLYMETRTQSTQSNKMTEIRTQTILMCSYIFH